MRTVSEQEIISLAPNTGAVSNGRKISSSQRFVSRMRSADDTFYMGECKGSGKSNYRVSADFVKEGAPVFRCSCPSRQFPCKHAVALLFEIEAGKDFPIGEIPEDILEKRVKKEARERKAEQAAEEREGKSGIQDSGEEGSAGTEKKGSKSSKARSGSRSARTKKLKKQLEGLAMLGQLTDSLLTAGLASMGSISLKEYRELSKQLGDYYLPGPQAGLNRLIFQMEKYQKIQDEACRKEAVRILIRLRALRKKGEAYLTDQLGGIWRLDQLEKLGFKKENASLLQLAFSVRYDEAVKEYIDEGFWADIETGEVSVTRNYRPLKALKYIKQEDSCFSLLKVPLLLYYPGEGNRRIRWDTASFAEPEDRDRKALMEKVQTDFTAAVKQAKGQLKNTLSDDFCAILLAFSRIGRIPEEGKEGAWRYAAEDRAGNRIELRDRKGEGWEPCTAVLDVVSDPSLLQNQVLFGFLYYDEDDRSICLHPRSIVTEKEIVRLLY